jgi:alcohol dehydrogenase (cytochrome c)
VLKNNIGHTAVLSATAVGALLLSVFRPGLSDAQNSQSAAAGSAVHAGRHIFLTRCASCHGTDANGGEFGPSILGRVRLLSDTDLIGLLQHGLPSSGMPAFPDIAGSERADLIGFLRTLTPPGQSAQMHVNVRLQDGQILQGVALNRSVTGMQVLGDDHQLHLLRKTAAGNYRRVNSQSDWPNYDGRTLGNRYSTLQQVTASNVSELKPQWVFTIPDSGELQVTPTVLGGVMYVTVAEECYALDAGSGREIWHYRRQDTRRTHRGSGRGKNRGAAISGDRVFMATDDAHLIALNRLTGALIWDTKMADWRQNYTATSAPLVFGNTVVAGIAGGDDGARGFLAAYDQSSGKELWRFWTVPAPGDPGSQTWKGTAIDHPGGSTWMSGDYDPELDTIYWAVGNPGPDLIGENRLGDNLYTDSILALEPKTGKLKWYFQFTPHDVHDFDAMAPSALIDATWKGKPRKLLVQANRNGFFYVLDRTDGKFLFGRAYTKDLTWAKGLTPEGRPIAVPGQEATEQGTMSCPWLNGASNWYSTSYDPLTRLYYVQTNDKCGIYTRTDMEYHEGRSYMGGSFSGDPAHPGQRILRAFDIHTGEPVWQLPQIGDAASWGGVLSTAGGVVFFGSDDEAFSAADAKDGKLLWRFQTNASPHASPMTYEFDHQQYVAVAMGPNVFAFGLPK